MPEVRSSFVIFFAFAIGCSSDNQNESSEGRTPVPSVAKSNGAGLGKAGRPPRQKKIAAKLDWTKIVVSPETTYLTEPLTDDGRVDYIAAINQRFGKGITPENNAAVLYWQASGPQADVPNRYFELLGTERPGDDGHYFVPLNQFVKQQKPELSDEEVFAYYDVLETARTRPWTAEEFPLLADWLATNRETLDRMVEGTRRPKFFSPCVARGKQPTLSQTVLPELLTHVREFARTLPARAMNKLAAEGPDAAWEDLLACHRLARQFSEGRAMVHLLLGIAVDGIAHATDRAFANFARLTPQQYEKIQSDLLALKPSARFPDAVLFYERCWWLDLIAQMATRDGPAIGESDLLFPALKKLRDHKHEIDFNEALRRTNQHIEHFVKVIKQPEQRDRFIADLGKQVGIDGDGFDAFDQAMEAPSVIVAAPSPRARGRLLAAFTAQSILGAWPACQNAMRRAQDHWQFSRYAFAVFAYRSERGSYPIRLETLSPRLITATSPEQPTKPPHYVRMRNNFLLSNMRPDDESLDDPRIQLQLMSVFDRCIYDEAIKTLESQAWEMETAGRGDVKIVRSPVGVEINDRHTLPLASIPTLQEVWIWAGSEFTENGLARLLELPRLRRLDISNAKITDGMLAQLARNHQLRALGLHRSTITDAGIGRLTSLQKLNSLHLSSTSVTDAGLAQLAKISRLETLSLSTTKITDNGLRFLAKLNGLAALNVGDTRITDRGLAILVGCDKLKSLDISRTKITDEGLKSIAKMQQLAFLTVDGTQITDAGLDHLKPLGQLEMLSIQNIKLSDAAIEKLQESLPECTIARSLPLP